MSETNSSAKPTTQVEKMTRAVSARFVRLIGVFLLVLAVVGFVSFETLFKLKVNGPIYDGIVEQKDVLADILPPPLYILESYMITLQMLGENNPSALAEEINKIKSLKQAYMTRSEYWSKPLAGTAVGRLLAEDSHKPALDFFDTLEKELIPALQQQDLAAATAIASGKLKSAYLEHRKAIDQAVILSTQNSEQYEASAGSEVRHREIILLAVLLLGFLGVGFYSWRIRLANKNAQNALEQIDRDWKSTMDSITDVIVELERSAVQTATTARQVSRSSDSLSHSANEQAASVEETSASLEEMTSMTRATADNAQQAKALAVESRSVVESGCQTMVEMDATMVEMNQAMAAIDSSSAEVAKIVKGIDEIAFQTNILALNAAVEAARAGEAGAGFAVVADEVRSLAQRSAAAAKETATKIEAAIASSRNGSVSCSNGSASSTKVGQSLRHIAEKMNATDSLIGDIAHAAREQAQGIEQINAAIAQMEKATQNNASGAEESASAAEELSAQAEKLQELVGKLQLLVGEEGTDVKEAPPKNTTRTGGRKPSVATPSRAIPMPADAHDADFRNF